MLENVPGLARDKRTTRFCAMLARMGYESEFRVLDAARFGVPQRRRRMILLASRIASFNFAPPNKLRKTVRDAIGHLPKPGLSGDLVHNISEKRSELVKSLIKSVPIDGGSRGDLPAKFKLECHDRCDGFKDVYGRMLWDEVAPTITGGCFNPSKGRFLHPTQNRTITMREAALLQGFPEGYKFDHNHGKITLALLIGNALPPPFVAAQARVIRRVLRAARH
jgi:DNA (cytosine-5)-methyltransferase 1